MEAISSKISFYIFPENKNDGKVFLERNLFIMRMKIVFFNLHKNLASCSRATNSRDFHSEDKVALK